MAWNINRTYSIYKTNFNGRMELSSVATEGVGLCGDSARVGDRAFRNLVQVTLDILLKKKNEESLKS